MNPKTLLPRVALIATCLLAHSASAPLASAQSKKVLLIAGPPSHGYGAHEHYAGLNVLAESMRSATDQVGVEVVKGWPAKAKLDAADGIVIYCDGGRRHIAFEHRDEVRELLQRGGGLVALHYAVEMLPDESGDDWTELLGGHFQTDKSVNPHWVASFDSFPDHPIARGVKPFSADDEWYFNLRFAETGVTPILSAVPPPETMRREDGHHSGNPEVRMKVAAGESMTLAWAYEPPFGGRSFGFTGGHNHWNWGQPSVRKLVVNAIRWTVGDEIQPSDDTGGEIPVTELSEGQDEAPPKDFEPKKVAESFNIPVAATGPRAAVNALAGVGGRRRTPSDVDGLRTATAQPHQSGHRSPRSGLGLRRDELPPQRWRPARG